MAYGAVETKRGAVVAACVRALSPYDCRRHFAALAALGEDPSFCALRVDDLRPEQRAAIKAGFERAWGAARRARVDAAPAPPEHICETPANRREAVRRRVARHRALVSARVGHDRVRHRAPGASAPEG